MGGRVPPPIRRAETALRRSGHGAAAPGCGWGAAAGLAGTARDARGAALGLVEMVDASERFDPAPLAAKLADITVEDRHLRIFETSDPNLLLVKEKDLRGNHEYAIERDEGLVADLRLYAQAPQ